MNRVGSPAPDLPTPAPPPAARHRSTAWTAEMGSGRRPPVRAPALATSAHVGAWPGVRVDRRVEPARGAPWYPASRDLQAAERRLGAHALELAAKRPRRRRDALRREPAARRRSCRTPRGRQGARPAFTMQRTSRGARRLPWIARNSRSELTFHVGERSCRCGPRAGLEGVSGGRRWAIMASAMNVP